MIAFSHPGMVCRHILASLHFNKNLQREAKRKPDGTNQYRVMYPKFKNGVATVRAVTVQQCFDYVDEIYKFMEESVINESLPVVLSELIESTPCPMNTMLDKQDKAASIAKHIARKSMITEAVPSTSTVQRT
ncbi:uncharacterized protein LOC135693332 [Rhopilema esculentum]|uniref:uncharacterized protein LOC135693332 n=1 Tax=Rhopilema esculentum TaxID=499914 RepID=UPI0031DA8786